MTFLKTIPLSFRKLLFSSLLSFCLLLTAYGILLVSATNAAQPDQVCFSDRCVNVEVVESEEARAKGLQGRASMPADHGMLFVFPENGMFDFWMKDTLIPLDIIWLSDEYKVVDVKEGILPCAKDPCPAYMPSGVSRYVLEVNAGYARTYGLKTGDEAVFK